MKKVTIDGKNYPFRLTIGATVDYKRDTGEDFSKFNGEDMEKMLHIIFHGIKSACKTNGVEFPYQSPDDIADYIEVREAIDILASAGLNSDSQGLDADDGSKKK
ncbi:MAG: hypothetical protein ACI3ZY_03040 [Parabacteroides sp.]